jgi:hypothetical protein
MRALVKTAFGTFSVGHVIPECPAMLFDYLKLRGWVELAPEEQPTGGLVVATEPIAKKPKRKTRKKD